MLLVLLLSVVCLAAAGPSRRLGGANQNNTFVIYCNECLTKYIEYTQCRRDNPLTGWITCSKPSYCEMCGDDDDSDSDSDDDWD